MRRKVHEKKEENRIKLMKKRWPNFELTYLKKKNPISGKVLQAVNSAGRIYWMDKSYFQREHVLPKDIGPDDDILYTLQRVKTYRAGKDVDYLQLKVEDLKNNSCREFTKGLPPTTHDTSWIMRVLKNKIVLCNDFGEVFILTYNETLDQQNLECSFSLPSIDIPREKLQIITMQSYMCVTDKREVIIARSHGKEVYICPITEGEQMEGMIRVPLKQHEKESKVFGVAFDVTHKEDVVVLRNIPHLYPSFQIEVYSRNGVIRNVYPLYKSSNDVSLYGTCLLSNPKGIVVVIQKDEYMFNYCVTFWHLVGKVFLDQERKFS